MIEYTFEEWLKNYGLIKQSSVSGKWFSACALNEEITIEVKELKEIFGNTKFKK